MLSGNPMDVPREHNIQLTIPSILGYERIVKDVASGISEDMEFPEDRTAKLRMAVGEACANAIEHGNREDPTLSVRITFTRYPSRLEIEVLDQGSGLKEKPKLPDADAKFAGTESPRGWGVFLMERTVDEVSFGPGPEGGHVTRLVVHL